MALFRTKHISAVLASAVTSQNIPVPSPTTVPTMLTIRHKLLTKRSTSHVTGAGSTYATSTQTAGAHRAKTTGGLIVASGASTRTVTVMALTASNVKVLKTGAMSDQTVTIDVACPAT